MAERKRTNGETMPPQIPEMPEMSQEMGAMFGLLGMMQQVREIHEGMSAMIGLQEKIIKLLEQPKPPPTLVASTAQMYPGLRTAPAEKTEQTAEPDVAAPASRRPVGWWGRLFPTRETHE
jgi:hypothetical protein